MLNQFQTVGIVGKYTDQHSKSTLNKLVQFLTKRDCRVVLDTKCAELLGAASPNSAELNALGAACDLLIAVGGDGTFLAAMRAVANSNTPLLGINLGRLGFLVDISPDEIDTVLAAILQGDYREERRFLLNAKIIRDGATIHQQCAANEIAVHRWVTPSIIEIITHLDGVYLNSQRSDGLVVATPIGSTAYALSAGGPILHPALDAITLVPLNPHTLSNRPIVIDANCKVQITFGKARQINALVSCDHLDIPDVLTSDEIIISKHHLPIKILQPKNLDYFHILRKKLGWSNSYPHATT